MRIAVFGVGGVGSYFGGRLAEAGEDVIFIARGENLNALRQNGLKVKSIKGDFTIHPAQVTNNPEEVGVVDMVVLGTKAWQVPESAVAIKPMVGKKTFVLPLQNGVESTEQLAAVLGIEHVIGGLCGLICFSDGPGCISHVAVDPFIHFGELDNSPSDRIKNLLTVFGRTIGVNAEIPLDIKAAIWKKFLFIVTVSGVGAITRSPMGTFRSVPESRKMLGQVMEEVVGIAKAMDISLDEGIVNKTLEFIDTLAGEGTASMQRDIMEGRPSELEAQNGAIVRLGKALGVPTPINSFIYQSLLPMELHARGQL